MIPDECALAVRDGVCVVSRADDDRPDREETGVYANNTQYLREFAVQATDRDAPESGWECLERRTNKQRSDTDHGFPEVITDG